MSKAPRLRVMGLLAAGVLQLSAWWWIRQLGDLSLHVHELWWSLLPILAGYCLAALACRGGQMAHSGIIIVGVALCSRLLLLDTAPTLSDDIYRYVWDGRVQAAGLNPYSHAPEHDSRTGLRDDDWSQINHPELVTVYPPVAQWFFHAVVRLAPGVTAMKAALVACDLLLIFVLWRWLRRRSQAGWRILLYAWHPLPVIEIAGNGHVDILGVLCLCTALLWLCGDRRHLAAWALAAAVLGKMIPLLCLGAFWRRLAPDRSSRWLRTIDPRPRLSLLWVPVLVVTAYLPFLEAGAAMWSGLSAYAVKWRFNDSAYGLVYRFLSNPKPGWEWDDEALLTARWVCLGGVALVALWTALRHGDDVAVGCAAVLGAQLLLAPTVHPWYMLWVLPFMVLRPHPAWMAFSWLVFLPYHVLLDYRNSGVWQESTSIRLLEYVPVYLLLLWPVWRLICSWRRNERRVLTSVG
ncbi:MAG TPA: hypothetical protein QGF95_04735 [Candidatus Latescibacteria bacterium]|nr:hypothetical protein [Candidatus Latescibacterota bacterium]HJP29841.1 hypothetical protein [Candidatus Latescibacterota bacterium]